MRLSVLVEAATVQASTKVSINTFVGYRVCILCCDDDISISVPRQTDR
jgi:hypothetical protein